MKTLGRTIKELREKANLPQRKVAFKLDIDVAVLSRIENDNKFPKKRINSILTSISELFDISEADLKRMYKSDLIVDILLEEKDINEIIDDVKMKIKFIQANKQIQSELDF